MTVDVIFIVIIIIRSDITIDRFEENRMKKMTSNMGNKRMAQWLWGPQVRHTSGLRKLMRERTSEERHGERKSPV